MGVSILKKHTAQEPVVESGTVLSEVDKAAELERQISRYKADLKVLEGQYKPIQERLMTEADERFGPEEYGQLEGEEFFVQLGMKAKVTEVVDKEQLFYAMEAIKPGLFFELCKIGLTDIRKYLSEDQLEDILEESRSGKRKMNFIPKAV